jgi:hypothetical protein
LVAGTHKGSRGNVAKWINSGRMYRGCQIWLVWGRFYLSALRRHWQGEIRYKYLLGPVSCTDSQSRAMWVVPDGFDFRPRRQRVDQGHRALLRQTHNGENRVQWRALPNPVGSLFLAMIFICPCRTCSSTTRNLMVFVFVDQPGTQECVNCFNFWQDPPFKINYH